MAQERWQSEAIFDYFDAANRWISKSNVEIDGIAEGAPPGPYPSYDCVQQAYVIFFVVISGSDSKEGICGHNQTYSQRNIGRRSSARRYGASA
jgi:hypothetical protein